MVTKICSTCKIEKPISDFNKHRRLKHGVQDRCKVCHRAGVNAWRIANPDKKKVRNQRRRAKKLGISGSYTAAQWQALKERYNHTCLRCGKTEPEIKLTMDHILPISKGGNNSINNIQPLCGPCNSSKNTTFIDYRKQYEKDR